MEDGVLHVYQIKGNAMTSLGVDASTTTSHPYPTATFNGKASIQDITNPYVPVSVDGGAALQVTMTDRGEPGNTDDIGITVWNKSGGLWYSSNWNSTKTANQVLNGGNIKVRGASYSVTTVTATARTTGSEVATNEGAIKNINQPTTKAFDVKASPNPSRSLFTLKVESDNIKEVLNVRVMDVSGKVIETRTNVLAGQTLQIGNNYRPGIYFIEVIQGLNKKQLKLIKL